MFVNLVYRQCIRVKNNEHDTLEPSPRSYWFVFGICAYQLSFYALKTICPLSNENYGRDQNR